jgi:hypothetical protein
MRDLTKATLDLRLIFLEIEKYERDRKKVLGDHARSDAEKDEDARDLAQIIARQTARVHKLLEEFADFPHWHARHAPLLSEFKKNGAYEDSVFVMTKYPDPKRPLVTDAQLKRVIDAVSTAVAANRYVPRVASDKDYHRHLWDNVELYMLGCRRGIAIVQDKAKRELNPNVAIEWGWMLGLNRGVLYLVEKDFKRERADWTGMIKYEFDWNNPEPDIATAVRKFLPPKE